MSARVPKLIDVIVCDEVRQENTGKLLVIGMYLDNVGVPRTPFMLPVLSFLCKWRVEAGVSLAGTFKVVGPSNQTVRKLDFPAATAPAGAGGLLLTTIRLQPFPIEEAGQYRLMFKPEGGRARAIARFDVHTGQVSKETTGE
ncbi:MAG: hypothetical protein GXP25_15095 [Planctomycetes bacterium]|nr:hypothetical protein [Planctomycetota bacterium]